MIQTTRLAVVASILLLSLSSPMFGQQIRLRVGTNHTGSRGGGGRSGDDFESWHSDNRYGTKTYNATADEQKRMRIHWGNSSLGYRDFDRADHDRNDPRVVWVETKSLRPNRELLISGKLTLIAPDGQSEAAPDWVQGVNVIVARRPQTKLDWSVRQEDSTSACSDCVVEKDGSFHAVFAPGAILRVPGKVESFQIGLSLGIKDGPKITWKNTIPVLPQSEAIIRLPGSPVVSTTQQFIAAAPSINTHRFDSLPLVRAVNHLHSLGKQRAIAELKKFLKTAPDSHYQGPRDPANIDTADRDCVWLIVSLLFDPIDAAHPRPLIWWIVPTNEEHKQLDGIPWPNYPLVVEHGLPFLVTQFYGAIGGVPPDPMEPVIWASKHGRLREKPLEPGPDPFKAALTAIANLESKGVSFDKEQVREQAWRLVMEATKELPPAKAPKFNVVDEEDGPDWDARKTFANSIKLQWNSQSQNYDLK